MTGQKKNILVILLFIFLAGIFLYHQWQKNFDVNKEALQDLNEEQTKSGENLIEKEIYKKNEIEKLKAINSEVVGIVEIPNTRIYYPILQGKDNDFYLKNNINKEKDIHGSIYMDYECNINESDNLILYGHNMRDGSMFTDLMKYKDKEYMENNEDIYLYFDDKKERYMIIGSLVLNLSTNEKVFNFNSYVDSADNYNTQDYVNDIKANGGNLLVDKVEKNDKLITVSTCSYETDDSRFIVFATKVESETEERK